MEDYREAYRIDFSKLSELKPGPALIFHPQDGGKPHEIFFEVPEKADLFLRIDKKTTLHQPSGSVHRGKGDYSVVYLQPTMEETIKNLATVLDGLDPIYRYRADGKMIIAELFTWETLAISGL